LAITSLAGAAIFQTFHAAERIEASGGVRAKAAYAPAAEVLVGALDGAGAYCYVSESPELSNTPDPNFPHTIVWTALGSSHSYKITFTNSPFGGAMTVDVPAGQSSAIQYVSGAAPNKDYFYTVTFDGKACNAKYVTPSPNGSGTTMGQAWVHVSK